MLDRHDKFWAFAMLVGAILLIAITTVLVSSVTEIQLRILEKLNDGLLVVLGAAGMALFRTSQNAKEMNEILKHTVERLSTGDGHVNGGKTDVQQTTNTSQDASQTDAVSTQGVGGSNA